jgi:hypothetical protein
MRAASWVELWVKYVNFKLLPDAPRVTKENLQKMPAIKGFYAVTAWQIFLGNLPPQ